MLGATAPSDRSLDQASRLREMARPSSQSTSTIGANVQLTTQNLRLTSELPSKLDPRMVLISEYPSLQGAFELAWRLAQQHARAGGRTAIVDLSPSASRLPAELARLQESHVDTALTHRQSLWSLTPHGRGLTTWAGSAPVEANGGSIDIIAQPVGEYPTAEQLPRIYEQFLRTVGSGRRGNQLPAGKWNTIVLLSEAHGVPLDAACWQAADEILFALPKSDSYYEAARAALTARLSSATGQQRRLALWKHECRLKKWPIRRRARSTSGDSSQTLPGFENRQMLWSHQSHSLFGFRRRTQSALAHAARELAGELRG